MGCVRYLKTDMVVDPLVITHPQNLKGSNMYKFILTALVILAPSVALAGGGGGSKGNTGTIKATNKDQTEVALVALNPSAAMNALVVNPNATLAQFKKLGGVVVSPGEVYTFKNVKVGSNTVKYLFVPANATSIANAAVLSKSVTVAKGKTYNVDLEI